MAGNNGHQLNTELKKELSSLIISSNKGLTVKRLRSDYYEFVGQDVPFMTLGFTNFEQYLRSIPDTCRLIGCGEHAVVVPIVTEKNKHINDMILKQRPPKSNSRYRPLKRNRVIYDVKTNPTPPPKPAVDIKLPVLNPDSHKLVLPPPHDYILETRRQQNARVNKNASFNNNFNQPKPQKCQITNSCDNRLSSSNVTRQTDIDNSKTDEPSTSGLETKDVHLNYKTFNSIDTDSDDSDAEFFKDLRISDDDEFCYRSDDDDNDDLTVSINNLLLREDRPCSIVELPIVEEPHVSRVNNRVKEKLKQLIAEYPDGIWCSKLLRLYEEKFTQKLDPANFGFSSVIEMCDDLPDVFYNIRPNKTDWKLFDKTKPIPDIHTMRDFSRYLQTLPVSQNSAENTEPALPDNLLYTPTYKYPEDVLQPGETIERQWLVNDKKPGEYLEIVISEVYDPSKFWVQLKGPTTSDALNELMDRMQVFYMNQARAFYLNEFSVRIGLMCAALFMNEYHRAIVIKVFDDQTIKVFYMDYGTVAQVHLRKTCFLHTDFAELPMQAVRARLANIIPKEQNTMWPRAASKFMLQLIMEKDLIAFIHNIDYEQEIMDLIVTDTTIPDVDVHINDALVENNFAVFGNEAPLCSTSNAIIPNVHLYPSFDELENGLYPSVSDVITMLKLGHTYEMIFHGYFASSDNSFNSLDYTDVYSRCSTSHEPSCSESFYLKQEIDNEEEHHPEEITEDFVHKAIAEESSVEVGEDEIGEGNSVEVGEDEIGEGNSVEVVEVKEEVDAPCEPEAENVELDASEPSYEEFSPVGEDVKNYNTYEIPPQEPIQTQHYGVRKPPPGFENVRPHYNGNQFINMFKSPTLPLLPEPVYPLHPLSGYPLVQNPLTALPSYSLMNPNLNPPYNVMLSNPLFYNQLNQMMINQQREALFQTVQQVQMVEELRKLEALKQQQQFVQINQAQNFNIPNTSQYVNYNQHNFSKCENASQTLRSDEIQETNMIQIKEETVNMNKDLDSCSLKSEGAQQHDDSKNYCEEESRNYFSITTDLNEDSKDSISNVSEHICDRFVVKLKIKDSTIHVLKINDEFYVVSQEIISNLLKNDLSWKNWTRSVNMDFNSFPNKLVNIMNYENVYKQIKRYSITGINPANNLGCNVRLTSLKDVVGIVKKYGNKTILPDLKAGITHVLETPDMWRVIMDSTD